MVNSAIGCFPSCWNSWDPVVLLGGEEVLLQFVQPVTGAAVDQQITHLDHHAPQQTGVDGHLEIDRVARQSGQGLAQVLALGVADGVGGLHPGHPPPACTGRVLHQSVEGGDDVAGATTPHRVGSQPPGGRQHLAAEQLGDDLLADDDREVPVAQGAAQPAVGLHRAGEAEQLVLDLLELGDGDRLEDGGRIAGHPVAGAQAAEPYDEEVLGRLGSRNRVSGYAAAVFETVTVAELEEIEDQLFRFARTVESNRRLRGALGDRDLPVVIRQEVIAQLLGSKVLPATGRLAAYAVRGGRARDIVATLDALVEDAARARGWRVARVQAADAVGDSQRQDLSEALARLAGNPVDLQVTIDPRLLGGVVVQVGDLLVDSSTRHRLNELKEHLLASEEGYRIPGSPTRREATDG